MTVSTVVDHNDYVGNGTTTSFPYTFRIFEKTDLAVSVVDLSENITVLVLDTDYTVTNAGGYSGGNVVLNAPLTTGWQISIARELEITQETDLRNQGKFFAEVHENAFDKLTMLIQQVWSRFSLALRKPSFVASFYDALGNYIRNLKDPALPQDAATKNYVDSLADTNFRRTLRVPETYVDVLPSVEVRKNQLLGWNDSGQPISVLPASGSASDVMIELAKPSGSQRIGTNHRGNLSLDLNAIDRRPDGYGNSISAVLNNGPDVEINSYMDTNSAIMVVSNKTVNGVGGELHETSGKAATWRVQGTLSSPIENVTFNGVRSSGAVLSTDDSNEAIESFAVFSRFSKNLMVNNVRALPGLTGGVYLSQAKNAIVTGVIAQGMVFHPNLARGGYGVLTDNAKESIINNVTMDVNASPDGRHLLYLATGAGGDYSGNRNIIATNLIGRWIGRDDRNQWFSNIRTSQRFIVNNSILEGGNGGIALNPENGPITDYIISNKNFDIVAYDSNPVYGVGQINVATSGYNSYRFLITNGIINMRTKDSTTPRNGCVAYNITGSNGMLSNCVITAPGESSPILVGNADQGLQNVTICNIHDNIASGSATTAPLISFTGNSISNVTVRGVTTQRSPMFNRLFVVTDLTVDFSRKARINFSGGAVTKVDVEGITGTVTPTTTGFLVQFPSHVTQKAIENCSVKFLNAGQVNISSFANKVLTVNTYAGSGGVLNMLTINASIEIVLYS